MADDYSIRARITGDASEFKVAMEGAAASTEQNTARIKKALEEAKAVAAGYAQAIKNDQELLATGFGSNPEGGGASIVGDIKAKLAESEAGFAATKVKIAELQAELKGVPAASTAAASSLGLTEKQLVLMAQAVESAARQLKALPAIQEEVAARVNASVNEMAAIRKRADAEVAQSAKILGAIQVSGVAESGDARGQAALAAATNAHTQALQVQQEVQARQAAVTAEAAAREELLARATAQSTTATLADAQANVKAAIEKEGSAVAALKVSDAQEATRSGAQKQAAAIVQANEIIKTSTAAVAQIQSEVANEVGLSAEKMATYVKRATTEVGDANAALAANQRALNAELQAGNPEAVATMQGLQTAIEGATVGLAALKDQYTDLVATQQASVDAANEEAAALEAVNQISTNAAVRGQNLATIQAELTASIGKTSAELEGPLVRAHAAVSAASTALARDGAKLGPAIRAGIPGADAALATLTNELRQARDAYAELAATAKLKEIIEGQSTTTTKAAAASQAELKIQQAGSAVTALELAQAELQAANALDKAATSSNTARAGFAELEGSTQGILFAFSRMVAAIPGAQAVLREVFPLITAIAFIDILGQAISKFQELVDAAQGFGKEEKQRLEESIHESQQAADTYLSLRQKINETKTIGFVGADKLGIEAKNTAQDIRILTKEYDDLKKAADDAQKANNGIDFSKLKSPPGATQLAGGQAAANPLLVPAAPLGGTTAQETLEAASKRLTGNIPTHTEDEATLTAAQPKLLELSNKINEDREKSKQIALDIANTYFQRDIELQDRHNKKIEEAAIAHAATDKKEAEAEYAEGHITAEQKADRIKDALDKQYQAEAVYAKAHDALQDRLAAKGATPDYINEKIDQQTRLEKLQRDIDEVDKTRAKNHNTDLEKINEEHLKAITDKLPEVKEAAPEGHGAQAELAFAQQQQTEIQAHVNLHPEDLDDYKKALEDLKKLIPRLMGEAAKETEKEVKESVDEQYRAWERGGERSAVQIVQFWSAVRSLYADNAEVAKEADKKITESTKKVIENTRKLNEEFQKRNELEAEHADDVAKADITRKFITAPQTSLNPFAATPQQQEKQELGQVDLDRIQQRIKLNLEQQAEEKRDNQDSLDRYAKLQDDKLKLDNEYWAKKAALDNQKLQDEYQNYLKYYEQISGAFLKGVDEWILGQKRFSVAMFDAWRGIVTNVVHDIEQITAKWIESHLIMAALSKLFHPAPQFNPGAGPGHGYGPPVPTTGPGSPGFGNGGVLGTGQVPGATGAPVPVTVVGGTGVGGGAAPVSAAPIPGAITGGASAIQTDVAAQQDAANKENAIWQQQIQKYLGFNQQKVISDQTTAAQQAAASAAASTEVVANDDAAAVSSITASAGVGAAKAFTALANIPIVGPALGAAAAAAALALIESFAHFETGGYTPKGGLAVLHPGEVVVNHPVTSLLSNIAARGGTQSTVGAGSGNGGSQQSSGGDTHVHFSPQIHAVDSTGVGRLLEQHGKQFVRYLKAQNRSGKLA